jgi:hypothetical protein
VRRGEEESGRAQGHTVVAHYLLTQTDQSGGGVGLGLGCRCIFISEPRV